MTPARERKLSINRCPVHGEFWSISLDGDSGGCRLTTSKCCGQWRTVKSWPVDPVELIHEIADDAGLTVSVKVRR